MGESRTVTEDEFRMLCEFLYRRTGMAFSENKRYYVERRVNERMTVTGAASFFDYFARLRADSQGEIEQFINAFTINETYFYREDYQFRCLTTDLLRSGRSAGRGRNPSASGRCQFDRRRAVFDRHVAAGELAARSPNTSRDRRLGHRHRARWNSRAREYTASGR